MAPITREHTPADSPTDTLEAYFFQCDEEALFAVSLDPSGGNIPRGACAEGWRLRTAFMLGVRQPVPAAIAPEPILRGIRAAGYYIWREGAPVGTSQ